tara:strand:+ start:311 stop:1033 length:723 start_codon:yes stop_codon:yes gene_type:complete
VYSLLKHNPDFDMDYIVLCVPGDLSKEDIDSLKSVYNRFVFKEINLSNYDSIRDPNALHHGVWTYYRIDMFLCNEYDKINYFDVDMLVTGSLSDFFKMREDDKLLACDDPVGFCANTYSYGNDHHFINAGVTVIGKNLITNENYRALIDSLSSELRHADQTLFINVFRDKIKFINRRYNTGYKVLRDSPRYGKTAVSDVSILHYCGLKKPWKYMEDSAPPTFFHKMWLDTRREEMSKLKD